MKINSMFKNQQFIFLIAVVAAGLGTLWILGDLASPILLSIVLAFLFRPLLIYLVQIGVPRSVSVVVTFLLFLFLCL
jgi:predicted PurR-regulated permease PerM